MDIKLLENLNKEQLEAVMHKDGPLLIIAGAGTGKTTVITQRIAYLIEQGIVKPEEVLALTFTEKAAGEMEERVDSLLPFGYLDLWISTFHGFGERILNTHGMEIGLGRDFKIFNEFQQWTLIKKNLDKFDLDYYRPVGNPTKFIHALLKHFSRAKDEDVSSARYLEYAEGLKEDLDKMLAGGSQGGKNIPGTLDWQNEKGELDKEIAEQEILRINEVANAYHVYQQLLQEANGLDFGDLINFTLELLRKRPKILAEYRRQFKYILLDEFQDTNWAQYELIKLLAGPKNNIVVVGDDDQSIYKFRGASISNILQFRNDFPEAKEIVLVNNYRNSQNILDLAYDFIQLNNPNRLEAQADQSKDFSKKLQAQKTGRGMIEVITGSDLSAELKSVVERIAELKIKDKSASWNDFAVLVRANESAKEICAFIHQAGLPYQFIASRGLYAKPLILDVIAYLKLLDDYHESVALFRILNLEFFGFSYQELINLNYQANRKTWSLYEVLKNASALKLGQELQAKAARLTALIEKHSALVRGKAASEVFMAFMEDSGYLKHLISQDEQKSLEAANYLNRFMKRIEAFEAGSDDKSVKRFLEELDLEIESGEEGALGLDVDSGPEAIKVMTIHGAKGLEFKYVFITNMVDKRFPTIARREPIMLPDSLVKEIIPEGDIHLEEERRLFYVAITRAKEGIFFSWAPDYGGARTKKASRFLIETKLLKPGKQAISSPIELKASNRPKKTAPASPHLSVPKYFSYSQLAAFSNCPYQYRFAHILRIPRRGKAQFSFGKTMHSVMQKIFELLNEKRGIGQGDLFKKTTEKPSSTGDISIDIKEIMALYQDSWIDDWYENKKQKQEYFELGRKILHDFFAKYKNQWPRSEYLEKGFNMKVQAGGNYYSLRGVIDRIDEAEGGIKIIDYKTGAPKQKLSFEEKEQLLIYQLAVRELFKEEIKALSFYYLENNQEIAFIGTDEELDKVYKKIVNTIENIQKNQFLPKPGILCKYCDFNSICEFRKI